MSTDILRQKFLDFFKARKHKIAESDSLVPRDDPTVLFTPAGMNQFKKQFMGFTTGFSRAATSQRCLRTDDLEKVGKTSGHHTFFEMLGNFSFGDYFKEEAISWAWTFLTEELKISPEKLWISVYKDDEEAYEIWKDKINIPAHKIVKLGDKDNFWPSEAKEKGPNGPCGPCSEIFFDRGQDKGCGKTQCTPACDCGRFIEIWNLVFTQFNRKEGGTLEPLPKKNIDTGMGLERMAALMQGAENNFETDLFKPLIKEVGSAMDRGLTNEDKKLVYAVCDHIRAVVFAIYDGVLPSNEARGYVVRKIIRKSALHLRALGLRKPFLYKLTPVLCEIMKVPYPELKRRRENISEIILAEEKNFIAMLDSSDNLLEERFAGFLNNPDPEKAGEVAFTLYDTYGLPLEITQAWLDKHKIKFSEEAFNRELAAQKNRSKSKSAMKGDVFSLKDMHLSVKQTVFSGYKNPVSRSRILRIIKDSLPVKRAQAQDEVQVILDKTPFYPESGGQISDCGELLKDKNAFLVTDTRKSGKVILHIGKLLGGSLKEGDYVTARINTDRRISIARNHTATHLLQAALRKVLGNHVQQQGSLVAEEKLRFDFTHFKALTPDELSRIEEVVNAYIMDNHRLSVKSLPLSTAKRSGALAFFGEKYEGRVRVVSISDVSREFCGGTHLDWTGQIGLFKITQEASVASGVRRIEAVTGKFAYQKAKEGSDILQETASLLNVAQDKIVPELNKRLSRVKELEKQLGSRRMDAVKLSLEDLMECAQDINQVKLIAKTIDGLDMDTLRRTVDLLKQKTTNAIIALGSASAGRAILVMGVTADLSGKGVDASKMIPEVASAIGGSGGGRKDFAQAGGVKPENFDAAFAKLKEMIQAINL